MPTPRIACVTVNLQGTTVERLEAGEDFLYGRLAYGKYMAAVGCHRLFEVLRRHDIKATVFVPGAEAERHPGLVEDLARAGHEIAAHGYAMETYDAGAADEAELLARTHGILTKIAGTAPTGWRAPHGKLAHATLEHLAALGYRYDASFQDDDQPYALDADGGRGMIEVPQNEVLIDATLYAKRQTHDRVMKTWREEVEALYDAACLIPLTLHPRSDYGSGRASRVEALGEFLTWLRVLGEVRFRTCAEIAADTVAAR